MKQYENLIKEVLGALLSHSGISQPLYCSQITTEADGEELSDNLPLIYIWNEDLKTGSCSISVNGSIVGETLEFYLPRSDPSFTLVRNEIMDRVRHVYLSAIGDTCRQTGLPPSVVFSSDAYLARRKNDETLE